MRPIFKKQKQKKGRNKKKKRRKNLPRETWGFINSLGIRSSKIDFGLVLFKLKSLLISLVLVCFHYFKRSMISQSFLCLNNSASWEVDNGKEWMSSLGTIFTFLIIMTIFLVWQRKKQLSLQNKDLKSFEHSSCLLNDKAKLFTWLDFKKIMIKKPGVWVHTFFLSPWEVRTGG